MQFTAEDKKMLEEIFAEGYASGERASASNSLAAPPAASQEIVFGTAVSRSATSRRQSAIFAKKNAGSSKNTVSTSGQKLARHANANEFPKDGDVFRFKYHGLFHVAPAENAFMLRLRIPGCRLKLGTG